MSNIVAEESKLHGDEAEVDGIEQLKPEGVDGEEENKADDKEGYVEEHFIGVVGRLLIEQSLLFDELFQLGVFIWRGASGGVS